MTAFHALHWHRKQRVLSESVLFGKSLVLSVTSEWGPRLFCGPPKAVRVRGHRVEGRAAPEGGSTVQVEGRSLSV